MKRPYLLLIAVFSNSLLFNSQHCLSAKELSQWVDENGVKHFSQQPPAHRPDLKAVDIRGTPVLSGGEARPQDVASGDTEEEQSSEKLEVERIENPEKDAELCEQARHNIAQMNEFRRVRAKDPETGEMRYLDDEEKESQLKNWKERESTFC